MRPPAPLMPIRIAMMEGRLVVEGGCRALIIAARGESIYGRPAKRANPPCERGLAYEQESTGVVCVLFQCGGQLSYFVDQERRLLNVMLFKLTITLLPRFGFIHDVLR